LQENCLQDAPPKLFRSRTPIHAPPTDNAQTNCSENPAMATIERIVFARAVSPSVNILDSLSIQLDLDKS
jgi:hypothetical protein